MYTEGKMLERRKTMKIAICDDNPTERTALKSRLDATGELSGAEYRFFDDGDELIREYEKGERYDLVLLDVEMEKVDGIDTGNYISSVDGDAMIIFVTSYPQYALDAFDCNAFHYLLKSSDDDRFNSVIHRALQHYKKNPRFYTLSTKVCNPRPASRGAFLCFLHIKSHHENRGG